MKKTIISIILGLSLAVGLLSPFSSVEAKTIKVKGYFKPSTGTYVMPSYRTSPNRTKLDNWSTKGNYNPYTGKKGYVNLYKW